MDLLINNHNSNNISIVNTMPSTPCATSIGNTNCNPHHHHQQQQQQQRHDHNMTPFQANYHYFNLNSQLKYDLEQQNAIKLQQLEAIKLIQISLDKLTAATTVPLHNSSKLTTKTTTNSPPTILVYKETNLHKNLLVSKILNKAKYVYYQSIVQTMRLSLMSKLNYYSSLIQQLNSTTSNTSHPNAPKLSSDSGTHTNEKYADSSHNITNNETNLVDEMKFIMQQILHDTYQFNLNAPSFNDSIDLSGAPHTNVNTNATSPTLTTTTTTTKTDLSKPTCITNAADNLSEQETSDQMKRIKQLNDVKLSLYSLLFPAFNDANSNATSNSTSSSFITSCGNHAPSGCTPLTPLSNNNDFKTPKKLDENSKRKRHHHHHHHHHHHNHHTNDNNNIDQELISTDSSKKLKKYQTIDLNNNHIVILSDDTNSCHNHPHRKSLKRNKSPQQQHISSRLIRTTLDAVVNSTTTTASTPPTSDLLSPESPPPSPPPIVTSAATAAPPPPQLDSVIVN